MIAQSPGIKKHPQINADKRGLKPIRKISAKNLIWLQTDRLPASKFRISYSA
jgi:hypothetical protein